MKLILKNRRLAIVLLVICLIGGVPLRAQQKIIQGMVKEDTPVAKKSFSYSSELESLSRLDLLPVFRSNCIVEQVSSYDRTGGNDDGFNGTYSYIRKENGKLVVADLKGPGIINRIWTPTPTTDTLEFYFDGEKSAGLKISFQDLFTNKQYPFIEPVCGEGVGGFYCYLPIPYKKSCKVILNGPLMKFYQIQYRNMPGYEIESFSSDFSSEADAALKKVCRTWQTFTKPEIKAFALGESETYQVEELSFSLKPGEEKVFYQIDIPGRILGYEISTGQQPNRNIFLNAVWDKEGVPAINIPLQEFFGYAAEKPSMNGMMIGSESGRHYCFLPCPFDSSAQVKLQYHGEEGETISFSTKVYYNTKARIKLTEGKLYTHWHREINPQQGKHYEFLSVKGKGHYVGTIHNAQGLYPNNVVFFEGDDLTHVDGKMRIHGTGSEDYYNGGWYDLPGKWDCAKSLPLHGCLDYNLKASRTGGFRFYTTDKLSFEKEFYMGIEHGMEGNTYPVDYTSVAFYYLDKP